MLQIYHFFEEKLSGKPRQTHLSSGLTAAGPGDEHLCVELVPQ